jgi:predicted metalloprotease with PDZ domain
LTRFTLLPLSFLSLIAALPAASVHYELSFPNAVHHEAQVRVTFTGVTQPVLEVVMSSSSPGRYAIHEFAKNVYNFKATDAQGRPLPVSRPNISGWNVNLGGGATGPVTVEYTVFGDRTDGTYAGIDETHAHLNMPAVLAWAHGFEHAPVKLDFHVPPDSKWIPATQLLPNPDGSWSAPGLEWLMDSPIELSAQTVKEWRVGGETFRMALHHQGTDAEADAYAEVCKKIVLEEGAIFGGFPKYDDGTYTFLLDYLPYDSGDGMEHRDSTVISGPVVLKNSASRAIGAVSHEFFHCWNVKRIRPKSLEPFDFEHADMSGELWFAEGFTNYYGILALERAGLMPFEEFTRDMGSAVNAVTTHPGRQIFSAVEMSEHAPFVDAATAIDPTNTQNTFISYYTYGQALAFGIDLAIRARYPGKSLDDWMRTMWREHGDIEEPYTLADLQQTLSETTGDKAFAEELFTKHIIGKEPLAYGQLMEPAGLALQLAHPGKTWLGVQRLDASAKGVQFGSAALRGSPVYQAGLEKGDEIVACDGKDVKSVDQLDACLGRHSLGDKVKLKAVTRGGEKEVEVTLQQDPRLEVVSNEHLGKEVTGKMKEFREAWLASKAAAL